MKHTWYDFFDSKDIREHYKEHFELTPAETVLLIYHNYGQTVETKIKVLEELLNLYVPDEFKWEAIGAAKISSQRMYQGVQALKDAYQHIVDEPEEACVYSVVAGNGLGRQELLRCSGDLFSTYEKAYAYMQEQLRDCLEYEEEDGTPVGSIRRYYLDLEYEDSDVLYFDKNCELKYVDTSRILDKKCGMDSETEIHFKDFYMPIHLPFKKGEIVKMHTFDLEYTYGVFCYSEEEVERWKNIGFDCTDFEICYDFIEAETGKALWTDDAWALSIERVSEEELRELKGWNRYLPVMALIVQGKYDFTVFEYAKLNRMCERDGDYYLGQYLEELPKN